MVLDGLVEPCSRKIAIDKMKDHPASFMGDMKLAYQVPQPFLDFLARISAAHQ